MNIEPPYLNRRGSLLDIDAANGAFLKVMRDPGWTVRGVDISPEAMTAGRRAYGLDLIFATPKEFQPAEHFDMDSSTFETHSAS
jgi:2-polyprenyl-3-methyl-5-hydroxy-6-metoxy-1,4-benzoquinol methylase